MCSNTEVCDMTCSLFPQSKKKTNKKTTLQNHWVNERQQSNRLETNLNEVVEVTQFAHVGDTLLLGHILENLSQVVFGVWKEKRSEWQGYCYPEQRDTCTELDFRVTCWRRWNRNAATESGARRGTCFKYKQPFPSSDSDRHGDGRKQERRLLPLHHFLTLGLFCLLNSHQNTTVLLTSYLDRFIKEEVISCISP